MKLHLTFTGELVKQPVIHEIGRKFRVVTNIRRANVTETEGWVDLELSGEPEELQKALDALRQRGVKVDPIEGSVIQ